MRTHSSAYLVDADARTVARFARDEAVGGYEIAQLRRDGEPLPMLSAPEVTVGQRMLLLLLVREDGVRTVRETTPVVELTKLDGLEPC